MDEKMIPSVVQVNVKGRGVSFQGFIDPAALVTVRQEL